MRQKLFALTELNHLRLEAVQLFEQCLTQGDLLPMMEFIEKQIVYTPPRLQLLRDITDDLQQRLLSLKEYHFDVRERVVTTLEESYHVNLTTLAPQAKLDRYHHLSQDEIIAHVQAQNPSLNEKDLALIRKLVDASLQMAAQLHNDIQLTTQLFNLVLDWTEGMSVTLAREQWPNTAQSPSEGTDTTKHH
ncbi:MAG: hypothetical protein JXA10_18690 [Anaerolineae bacterium]|nr:hypothetical protein [Anaerolineae bacterium]